MASRALKLGTRRSALARAQSAAVARRLERLHPQLSVELVGIDTRGDRILDTPLSAVEGKEFFTAEIDTALVRGEIDFTVHSYKDLSLERGAQLLLAAVPPREPPHDVVLFARDVPERLAGGEPLLIGSSSPRRASFVPEFLQQVLPRRAQQAADAPGAADADDAAGAVRVRLVELRGNVDSRLRRLHEPRGSPRQLDGVVLAFAGLARLWGDEAARPLLEPLLSGLPRMVLPLSVCPPAPAQGALAIECRRDDERTAALLAGLDDPATRQAVLRERALLAQRGGGCQQRFGAVLTELPELGALLQWREAREQDGRIELQPTTLEWAPAAPLAPPVPPVRAWDGSRAAPPATVAREQGIAQAAARLAGAGALFVAHRRALPRDARLQVRPGTPVWVPGVQTWRALARQGIWVQGCADGLGIGSIGPLLAEPWLGLPPGAQWLVLTHLQASAGWPDGTAVATYAHVEPAAADGPPVDATHVFWASSAQFARWAGRLGARTAHACGPGKTYEHIRRAGVHTLQMFPHAQQWREWLQI